MKILKFELESFILNPLQEFYSQIFFFLEIDMTLLFSWFDFLFFRRRKEKEVFFGGSWLSQQFDWVYSATCWVLSVGAEFLPPTLACISFFFFAFASFFIFSFFTINTIHLLLPLDFSSSPHYFFLKKTLF